LHCLGERERRQRSYKLNKFAIWMNISSEIAAIAPESQTWIAGRRAKN